MTPVKDIIDSAIQRASQDIQRLEDRRVFRALNQAIYSPMDITIQPCVFGHALIATTWQDQLVAVELGATQEELMRNFINRWSTTSASRALHIGTDTPDLRVVNDVLKVINQGGSLDKSTLQKMSLYGTIFQRKVWQGMMEIPSGTTESYKGLAERIENASAIRAVSNAVAANPIAIIIPCHRIIHTSGKTEGYRWGNAIKSKLLERERV